jgi:hypothetical protein
VAYLARRAIRVAESDETATVLRCCNANNQLAASYFRNKKLTVAGSHCSAAAQSSPRAQKRSSKALTASTIVPNA